MSGKSSQRHLSGPRISPPPITGKESAADLIDQAFLAYNAARLREGARLLVERMLGEAKISPGDLDLILLTDDPQEAAHAVIQAWEAQSGR